MILSLSEVLSEKGPQTEDDLAQLLPFWTPTANVNLLNDAIEIGSSIGLFRPTGPELALSNSWQRIPGLPGAKIDFARAVLQKFVTVHFSELIAYAYLDIRKVRNEIDDNMRAILDDCRLLEIELDVGATEWWEYLRSLGQFAEDPSKKEIGTGAEKLTVAHEISLLEKRGILNPHHHVSWVAEQNDRAGFDVLSMNLDRVAGFSADSALRIEVKVGRKEDGDRFSLMFTRHEHRVMLADSMPWVLHVWLFRPEVAKFRDEPITISREAVARRIPETSGDFEWENARLTFPHNP